MKTIFLNDHEYMVNGSYLIRVAGPTRKAYVKAMPDLYSGECEVYRVHLTRNTLKMCFDGTIVVDSTICGGFSDSGDPVVVAKIGNDLCEIEEVTL